MPLTPNGSKTVENLALGIDSDDENSQKLKFEEAKKHFSMYGRRHDHVSHLTELQEVTTPPRPNGTKNSPASTRKAVVRTRNATIQLINQQKSHEEPDKGSIQLKNTLLLQENGELAIHLDEINYHIDGLVATTSNSTASTTTTSKQEPRDPLVDAQSVLELILLLQKPKIQSVLRISSHFSRLGDVILLLRHHQDVNFSLSLASLAFFLTRIHENVERDDFVTEEMLEALAVCLKRAIDTTVADGKETSTAKTKEPPITALGDAETTVKTAKSFLKRKKKRRSLNGLGDLADDESLESMGVPSLPATVDSRFSSIRQQLESLLAKEEAFCLDGKLGDVSLVELLLMVFYQVLQIDDQQPSNSPTTNRAGGESMVALSRSNQFAKETFHRVLSRKILLVHCGALDALLTLFKIRFDHVCPHIQTLLAPTSLQVAMCFQRLRNLLKLLDQVSFLATRVQQFLATHATLFSMLLQLIDQLSDKLWTTQNQWKWQQDASIMTLASDVLLACCRVVINLTHHNEVASQHVFKAEGTRILFGAFCRMWTLCQHRVGLSEQAVMEDKLMFDGLLLTLSALMNVIEISERNRTALCQLQVTSAQSEAFGSSAKQNICSLLVSFFKSQIASFEQFLQDDLDKESVSVEFGWNPEDVILGGVASLLLGSLMPCASERILEELPAKSPRLLLKCLSAFVALHSQLGALTPEVGKSVLQVERTLKSYMPESQSSPLCQSPASSNPRVNQDDAIEIVMHRGDKRDQSPCRSNSSPSQYQSLSLSGSSQDHNQDSLEMELEQLETMRQQILDRKQMLDAKNSKLNTPPAAAFRMKRTWKNVCTSGNVSDSMDSLDDADEDRASCQSGRSESSQRKRRILKRKRTWKNSLMIFSQEDDDDDDDDEGAGTASTESEPSANAADSDKSMEPKASRATNERGYSTPRRTQHSPKASSVTKEDGKEPPSKRNRLKELSSEKTSHKTKKSAATRTPSPLAHQKADMKVLKTSTVVQIKTQMTPRAKQPNHHRSSSVPNAVTTRATSPRTPGTRTTTTTTNNTKTKATPSPRPKSASAAPLSSSMRIKATRKAKPTAAAPISPKPKPQQQVKAKAKAKANTKGDADADADDVFEFDG